MNRKENKVKNDIIYLLKLNNIKFLLFNSFIIFKVKGIRHDVFNYTLTTINRIKELLK